MVEDGPQRRQQILVDLVGDQLDDTGLRPPGDECLHRGTAENADARGGIEDLGLLRLAPNSPGHEISDWRRREKETVVLPLPIGFLSDAPFADAVGIGRGGFCRAGSGHGPVRLRGRGRRVLSETLAQDLPFQTGVSSVSGSSGTVRTSSGWAWCCRTNRGVARRITQDGSTLRPDATTLTRHSLPRPGSRSTLFFQLVVIVSGWLHPDPVRQRTRRQRMGSGGGRPRAAGSP